jgi:hypothetical protein
MAGKNPVNYSLGVLQSGNPKDPIQMGSRVDISSFRVPTIVVDSGFTEATSVLPLDDNDSVATACRSASG